MARIRTIKPEFWTDERIVELSPMARLFFIGMWNFADDHGGIERGARQLKMRILPGDDVEAEPLVQELLRSGMVFEYEADGAQYLNIKNFLKHQRINRPSPQRIPSFNEGAQLPEDSLRTHGGFNEDSCPERKGSGKEVERNGMERRGEDSVPSERTALRAEELDKTSAGSLPTTVLAEGPAASEAVGGERLQRPNVIFMKTPHFDDEDE